MNSPDDSGKAPLAIICGGGTIPYAVADAAIRHGRRVVLFGLIGWADPASLMRYPHHWGRLGQLGRFLRLARAEKCREVVLVGTLLRPSIRQLRPDWGGIRLLPRLVKLWRGGDDHLLSGVVQILEEQGFTLLGSHEVAPGILLPGGVAGWRQPGERDMDDIAYGLSLLAAMAPFDVGQAIVVADQRVLAIEAAEGTDGMLDRVAEMRRQGRIDLPDKVGVLVKAAKHGQERRVDLPTIGPQTVERVVAAGLAGLAVVAGSTIAAEPTRSVELADRAGIFIVGVSENGTLP